MRILFSILSLLAFTSSTPAQQIVRTTDRFEFVYEVTVPEIRKVGRMWVPLASSDGFQKVKHTISSPVKTKEIVDSRFGNRVLFASLSSKHVGEKLAIRYQVERRENAGQEDAGNVERFLGPSRLVPRNSQFGELAQKATASVRNPVGQARQLYWHTLERMRYDKSGQGWGRGDAMYACDARTGNCTDFHSYFIALARSLNIPARFSIGFTIPADRDEGAIAGYHCWAEYHANGRWTPIDVSEADKHPELRHYYLGHHPANRFQLSVGRDLAVDPLPKSGPINFLVYPILEVGDEELKPKCEFRFRRLVD